MSFFSYRSAGNDLFIYLFIYLFFEKLMVIAAIVFVADSFLVNQISDPKAQVDNLKYC